jgi:preprotein translocase subunit SecA
VERCIDASDKAYEVRSGMIGHELMRNVEKQVMLRQLDMHWKEHLAAMDHLRQGIGLRSYAQKNPKQEYKREAFEMFGDMLEQVKYDTISILTRIRVQAEQDLDDSEERRRAAEAMRFQHAQASALGGQAPQGQNPQGQPQQRGAPPAQPKPETFKRDGRKVGRNEPCPCGSGKKFKQCHGKLS